ncbi:MAG TPA: hypothetical protein VKY26_02515, partial [Actinomycetota bacterium]|nr:hypothetical protein [Actinomycetota bacterium]
MKTPSSLARPLALGSVLAILAAFAVALGAAPVAASARAASAPAASVPAASVPAASVAAPTLGWQASIGSGVSDQWSSPVIANLDGSNDVVVGSED